MIALIVPSRNTPVLFPTGEVDTRVCERSLPPYAESVGRSRVAKQSVSGRGVLIKGCYNISLKAIVSDVPGVPFRLFYVHCPYCVRFSSQIL